ncbi:hypothetical protein BHE74_00055275 [Ensete ventricosum]|nr:hypothetical protein BHE74_00055275 [Ensete ventricosum]
MLLELVPRLRCQSDAVGLYALEPLKGVKGLGKLKRRPDAGTSRLLGFWTGCVDEPQDLQADLGREVLCPTRSL